MFNGTIHFSYGDFPVRYFDTTRGQSSFSITFLWFSYGFPIVFLWFSIAIPLGPTCLWPSRPSRPSPGELRNLGTKNERVGGFKVVGPDIAHTTYDIYIYIYVCIYILLDLAGRAILCVRLRILLQRLRHQVHT